MRSPFGPARSSTPIENSPAAKSKPDPRNAGGINENGVFVMNVEKRGEVKLWNRSFVMLLIMSTFINSASQMIVPIVSKYAISLGAPLTIAATISSLMSFAALLLRPVAGLFSDRYNRKKIILMSNLLIAICLILMAVSRTVPMLVAVRLLHGVAFSFNSVALMAFNTVFIPKERLGEGIGWMALGNTVAQALGPNIGIVLIDIGGYGLCFFVAAGICLVGILVIMMMPYKTVGTPNTERRINLHSLICVEILPYAAILCLFSAGSGLVSSMLVLLGDERGITNIGLFFTVYSVTMVLIRPVAGKLVDSKGLGVVLYPSIIIFGLGYMILGQTSAFWLILVAAVMKAIGQGSGVPGIQSSTIKQVGREKAGVVSSTCFIGQDIGNTFGPMMGGFVAQYFGFKTLFSGFSVVFIVASCAIFYAITVAEKKKAARL